ncbi:MAG TPA: hypothetical protein VN633_06475 [Bryobacteraceae bacterium]|nr:hypothetical protein [Bryobacteraceae bacterium]
MTIALVDVAAVDNIAQFFARFEIRDPFGGNFDPRSRFRIPPDPRLTLPRPETAEAPDLDFVAGVKTVHNAFKDCLDDYLRILPRHLHNL